MERMGMQMPKAIPDISLDAYDSRAMEYDAQMAGATRDAKDIEYGYIVRATHNLLHSDMLTDKQREAVLLYYEDGLTVSDIAERMGIASPTVCGLLDRGEGLVYQVLSLCFPRFRGAPRLPRRRPGGRQFTFYGLTTRGDV